MISNAKRGVLFFDIFDPPPPRPPSPLKKAKKKGGSSVCVWGGGWSGPKTHRGMCLLGKIIILQGVKQIIQPFEVGSRPKKVGYVAFFTVCGLTF